MAEKRLEERVDDLEESFLVLSGLYAELRNYIEKIDQQLQRVSGINEEKVKTIIKSTISEKMDEIKKDLKIELLPETQPIDVESKIKLINDELISLKSKIVEKDEIKKYIDKKFDETISETKERINDIVTAIEGIRGEIKEIPKNVYEIVENVSKVVESIKGEINKIKESQSEITDKIRAIDESIEKIKDKLYKHDEEIAELNEKISSPKIESDKLVHEIIEPEVEKIVKKIVDTYFRKPELDKEVLDQIQKIKNDLVEITNVLERSNPNQDISLLHKEVNALKDSYKTLETSIRQLEEKLSKPRKDEENYIQEKLKPIEKNIGILSETITKKFSEIENKLNDEIRIINNRINNLDEEILKIKQDKRIDKAIENFQLIAGRLEDIKSLLYTLKNDINKHEKEIKSLKSLIDNIMSLYSSIPKIIE